MGYACPNYVSTGMVTEGSEIYSFGIVILEFLTGQPPAMNHHHFPGQTVHLVESLGCNMNALLSILDKRANWPEDLAVELGHIFFECCDRNVQKRPKFISVVKRLKGLSDRFTTYEPQQKILGNINQQIRLPKSPDVLMTSRQPQRGGDFNEFQTMMKPSVGEDRTPKSLPKATCYLEAYNVISPSEKLMIDLSLSSDSTVTIGRNKQTEIFGKLLQSDTQRLCVSRDHFLVKRRGERYSIVNLSGNGTLVVGRKFLENKGDEVEVMSGDIVRLVQTSNNGLQTPFIDFVFSAQSTPTSPPTCKTLILRIRNLQTLTSHEMTFDLDGDTRLIQVIGRGNLGPSISGPAAGLIDASHFGILWSDAFGCVIVRPLTDKGLIVGSDFVGRGADKVLKIADGLDIYFPGVSGLVMSVSEGIKQQIDDTGQIFKQAGAGQSFGQTMLGVPPLFNTARHSRW
jgi:hypothetical protein